MGQVSLLCQSNSSFPSRAFPYHVNDPCKLALRRRTIAHVGNPFQRQGQNNKTTRRPKTTPTGRIEPNMSEDVWAGSQGSMDDDEGGSGNGSGGDGNKPGKPKPEPISGLSRALIAAAFVCGLGAGVYYDSEVVLTEQNLSSTNLVDAKSPSADLCLAYGYSASVFDTKVYVTYNPFNVYVTQPVIKGGCVLRNANMALLEKEKLVERKETEACKNRMNTFAFTGDLASPGVSVDCVYHSESAENEYIEKLNNRLVTGK